MAPVVDFWFDFWNEFLSDCKQNFNPTPERNIQWLLSGDLIFSFGALEFNPFQKNDFGGLGRLGP